VKIEAVEQEESRLRMPQSGEQRCECRFSPSRRSLENHAFTGGDRQAAAAENRSAPRVGKAEIRGFEHGGLRLGLSMGSAGGIDRFACRRMEYERRLPPRDQCARQTP
jgi:hypothetical protein